MIKMEKIDETTTAANVQQRQNGDVSRIVSTTATTTAGSALNRRVNGTMASSLLTVPMDLSKANLTLTDALLLGASRSPLGIALSTAAIAGSTPVGSSPLLHSPLPTPSSAAAPSCPTSSPPPPPPSQPRRKVSAPLIGANGQVQSDCLICSDRATGKHYGAISCDGCKGFFRRTIRKKHNYVCRFNRNCVVDKNQRNSCRRCRFEKCLANGMRPEAVQLERDRIAATRRSNVDKIVEIKEGEEEKEAEADVPAPKKQKMTANEDIAMAATKDCTCNSNNNNSNGMLPMAQQASPEQQAKSSIQAEQTLQRLMDAEKTLRQPRRREQSSQQNSPMAVCPTVATTGDVTDSMHQQLILLVEWAKQLEEFRRLPLRSQIALLRHFSAQHLVICAAFRSLVVGADGSDAVWLANDRCVPRDAPKIPDVNRVVARILDHLTAPMRRLHLDEREFVALKAVAFFDPMAKDVEESAMSEVEETRQRILAAFEYQVIRMSEHRGKMPLRLANLLLLLPPLMAIGRDLVEEAQLAKLFGLANVDELMAELLLPEDAETRSYSRLRTSVTSSIVQSNVTSPTPPTTSPHRHQQQQQQFLLKRNDNNSSPPTPSMANGQQPPLAAPTPIYSMLQIGSATNQQQNLIGNFGK